MVMKDEREKKRSHLLGKIFLKYFYIKNKNKNINIKKKIIKKAQRLKHNCKIYLVQWCVRCTVKYLPVGNLDSCVDSCMNIQAVAFFVFF